MAISEKSKHRRQQSTDCYRTRGWSLHWAFKKLLTATGWPPSGWKDDSRNISSLCFSGRMPIYFWPRACMCSPILCFSYTNRSTSTRHPYGVVPRLDRHLPAAQTEAPS